MRIENIINSVPLRTEILERDFNPIYADQKQLVKKMVSCKSHDEYAIPDEVYKNGGNVLMRRFLDLLVISKHDQDLQEFKVASITHLFKRKRKKELRDNHQSISLFSVVGKIFTRVILNTYSPCRPCLSCGFRALCEWS